MPESKLQNKQALYSTLALHAAFIAIIWFASVWVLPVDDKASQGEPVQATLAFSKDDVARAKKTIDAAKSEQVAAKLQPKPSPRPQTSDQELQNVAQDWVDRPDKVSQEEVNKTAINPSDLLEEQKLKQQQAQVELTEDVPKETKVENKQRLKEQLLEVQKARTEAARQAQLEEQRLDELAANGKNKSQNKTPAEPPSGQRGDEDALSGKYKSAINATARANWNTVQIPEQTRCQVEFTQIRGGEVIDVRFLSCSLDDKGRESVERALYKSPMPFAGFERVFQRKVVLTFCYPDEVCQ
jgi:colicin import membrane protein